MKYNKKNNYGIYIFGIIPVIWIALLIAPYINKDFNKLLEGLSYVLDNPFKITFCNNSLKSIFILLFIYLFSIVCYESSKKNYRRGEEYGSAKWGNIKEINSKYMQQPFTNNKIFTKNTCMGLNAKQHRRNLNTLIIGGSGAGKTRFYAKINVMQCNTSFFILDPKGEILRDTGYLLEREDYNIKVLDLINMDKSLCYNPFVYLRNDNDVQRLVTNLFKATTPKGSQSSDSLLGYSSFYAVISTHILFMV